jgi:hypothetical protein
MTAVIIGATVVMPLAGCTTARPHAAHKASPRNAVSRRDHRTGHTRRPSRSYVPRLVLGDGPLFGTYRPKLPGNPVVAAWITRNLHPEIVEIYTKFGTPFETRAARINYSHGAMTLVQLDPWTVPLYRIASGKYNAYLRRYARAVARLRFRVGLSFAHEMNGEWYPWDFRRGGPAHFVAAWRRIHRIFAQMHATNVTWVWTISKLYLRNSRMIAQVTREDWPGKRYVDWVGVDGYFRFPGEDFSRVMTPTLRLIRTMTRKPVLLTETAVYPNAARALQLRELFTGIARDHLLGFIYFDANAKRKWSLHGKTIGLLSRLLRRHRYKELACNRARHICKPAPRIP